MTRPVLLVGAGRMGGALLKGWIREGIGPLRVVETHASPELRKLCRSHKIAVARNLPTDPEPLRACVVALKPQLLSEEAPRLRPFAERGALMISIAAGTRTRTLRKAWGGQARIVRAMPNTPGAIGEGISALFATDAATRAHRKLAQTLLAPLGETIWVGRESLMDAATAVSGSGPAYVFLLAEALEEAARAEGFSPEVARKLSRATVSGAGALLSADPRPAAQLRQDVTSPRGTTQAALDVLLARDGFKSLMAGAVRAARRRAKELGN